MELKWSFMNSIMKWFEFIYTLLLFLFSTVKSIGGEKVEDITIKEVQEHAEQLLGIYGNRILRLAYSYLHNMSDAEDVLQDTLVQYMTKCPKFESLEHEKAWLLRVAINISKNKISYKKIRKTDELCETFVAEELKELSFVWEAVKNLPPKYREVIHLFYHEGYSTKQIAALLTKKESTVRSLLQRARFKLKGILNEVYDFE